MMKDKFKISLALKNGYKFVGANWQYLGKMSVIPLTLHIVCNLFVLLQRPSASIFETYLWQLPAITAFAWLMFLEIRLLFFSERLGDKPESPIFAAERSQAKQASVIIFILFNMFFKMSSVGIITATSAEFLQSYPTLAILPILILAMLFWCMRYGLLHIVAAISFPLPIFIRRLKTPLISIQLLILTMVAVLPVMILFQMLVQTLAPELLTMSSADMLTNALKVKLVLITAPTNLLVLLLLNACAGYAVKYMVSFGSSAKQL